MGETFMLDTHQVVGAQPKPNRDLPCGRRWTAVQTHPAAERCAQFHLHRLGYDCYRPTFVVRATSRYGNTHIEVRSLFPGYVFVLHDPTHPWTPIRYCPGVHAILRDGDRLRYARPGDVEALQASDELRAIPAPAGASWAPGMPCSLATGPLAGQPAVVVDTNGLVATVAVMMLGQLRHVSVPVDSLVGRDDARG